MNCIVERAKVYNISYNNLRDNIIYIAKNCPKQIDDIVLVDSLNQKMNISSLFNNKKGEILFCRISDKYCQSCNSYVVNIAKNTSQNIVYLINKTNRKEFNNMKKTFCLPDNTYAISNINIPVDSLISPYLFVVNSNLEIIFTYVPQSENPSLDYSVVDAINKRVECEIFK